MKISVKVKLHARHSSVRRIDATHFEISINEKPIQGQANDAMIDALAEHLGIAKSRIHIVMGHTFRNKIIEIQ